MTADPHSPYGWNSQMGMSLMDKLKEDLKTALRQKDGHAKDTIRQVMAEFPNLTVPLTLQSGKKSFRVKRAEEITDDEIADIIRKLIKSEKTVLEARGDSESAYIDLLSRYLPAMADPDEIRRWIEQNIDFSQLKNPMQAMGPVMKHFGKTADGNDVKAILTAMGKG